MRIQNIVLIWVFMGSFLFQESIHAQKVEVPHRALAERLKSEIRKSGFKESELGIWVGASTPNGAGKASIETYFSQNDNKLFIPASLSKLITLGAVLHDLHPAYKFKTKLVSDAKIENGELTGPLYLQGGGDPSFVSENMWILVNELVRSGITSVKGDVVVDDTRFDQVRWGDDRQDVRVDRAYDAPLGAMSMNWNSATVYVRPGDKVGQPLKVYVDITSPYLKVRNETKTAAAGRGRNVSVERVTEKGFEGDVIVVSGSMALDQSEFVSYKNITRPEIWAGYNLVEFLKQRGINVKGKVRGGRAPKEAAQLAVAESKPLSLIAADMAKWSNNYVAEMLVKNLAAESDSSRPATTVSGLARVMKYLEAAGLKSGEFQFVNAAGFTRRNQMTPLQLGRFLEHVRSDFTIYPEFLSALPIAGIDGTLRSRMKSRPAERWVRAKTGLLNGVIGLAGFAGRSDGEVLSFVFIFNGGGREDRARLLFDRLAASLVEDSAG